MLFLLRKPSQVAPGKFQLLETFFHIKCFQALEDSAQASDGVIILGRAKKSCECNIWGMVNGEHGTGEMMVGHDDLKGLFQLQQFFDSVAIHILCFGCMVGWPQWGKDVEGKGWMTGRVNEWCTRASSYLWEAGDEDLTSLRGGWDHPSWPEHLP